MQAGIFPYDMVHVGEDLTDRYEKLGFLVAGVDWQGLFGVDSRMIHPKRFAVAVGNSLLGIMYHKTKVPKEYIPKTWNDCVNRSLETRWQPKSDPVPISMSSGQTRGEEWTLDFARRLRQQTEVVE
jgi:hypothetical protein